MEKRRHAIPTSPQLPWKIYAYLSYFFCTPSACNRERRFWRNYYPVGFLWRGNQLQSSTKSIAPQPKLAERNPSHIPTVTDKKSRVQNVNTVQDLQLHKASELKWLLPYFKSLGYNFLGFCCVENIVGVLWHLIHCKPYQGPVPGNPFCSEFAV